MKSLPQAKEHPRLIEPVRRLLRASGKLYVIENVPGAPMRDPFCLCGSMFGLKSSRGYLRRHRLFESNFPIGSLPKCNHVGLAIGVYGHGSGGLLGMRMRTANVDEARILMDMDWTTRDGMSQAIPPAYTEYVGRALALALQPGMKAAA
jgi:DNA (cytosine-5)-methyltransferase 1